MTTTIKINTNDGYIQHVATGGETAFSYDFPLFDDDHIAVYETTAAGVTNLLVKGTDYTITGANIQPGSGTLEVVLDTGVYPSGATATHKFTLLLNVPEKRTTDYNQAGDFLANVLNKELDLITQQTIQLRRDVDRGLTLPPQTAIASLQLPEPEANKLLAWNNTADALTNAINAIASTVTVGNGTTAVEISELLDKSYDVRSFGAVLGSTADQSSEIQAALNAAASDGVRYVILPANTTYWNVGDNGIGVPGEVTLVGQGYKFDTTPNMANAIVGTGATYPVVYAKEAELDTDVVRNAGFMNLRIEVTGSGNTAFRMRGSRSCYVYNVYIYMANANQIGFDMRGDAVAATVRFSGYNIIKNLRVKGDSSYTGQTGIKLEGLTGTGECNANQFVGLHCDQVNKGIVIKNGLVNNFSGVTLEQVDTTGIELSGTLDKGNQMYGVYFEDVTTCIDLNATSERTSIHVGNFNTPITTRVADSGAGNTVVYGNLIYGDSGTNVEEFRSPSDTYSFYSFGNNGHYYGDGTVQPSTSGSASARRFGLIERLYAENTASGSNPSVTLDLSNGHHRRIDIESGASGTLTINAPTNSHSESEEIFLEINNNSGNSITISWNGVFLPNAAFNTQIDNGGYLAVILKRRGTDWKLHSLVDERFLKCESGVFTPTATFATTGDLSVVYNQQDGSYLRQGQLLFFNLTLDFTPTFTTASGRFRLEGLPVQADGNTAVSLTSFGGNNIPNFGTSKTQLLARVANNTTRIELGGAQSNSTHDFLDATEFTTGTRYVLGISGTYKVD